MDSVAVEPGERYALRNDANSVATVLVVNR